MLRRTELLKALRSETAADACASLLRFFLFLSPWLLAYGTGALWFWRWLGSAVAVAISIATAGVVSRGEEAISVVLGLWFIVAPYLLGLPHAQAMRISIACGVVILYFTVVEVVLAHYLSAGEHP
jgi:predicted cobalt transporter CbtA